MTESHVAEKKNINNDKKPVVNMNNEVTFSSLTTIYLFCYVRICYEKRL